MESNQQQNTNIRTSCGVHLEFNRVLREALVGHEGRVLAAPLEQRREPGLVLRPALVHLLEEEEEEEEEEGKRENHPSLVTTQLHTKLQKKKKTEKQQWMGESVVRAR